MSHERPQASPTMVPLRALTLLVSALSASAFAPTGWSGRSRAAPVKSGYLELVESGLIDSMPAQKTFSTQFQQNSSQFPGFRAPMRAGTSRPPVHKSTRLAPEG